MMSNNLTPYREPNYKLARIDIINDITTYAVFNSYYHIVELGSLEQCLFFLENNGEDISEYQYLLENKER